MRACAKDLQLQNAGYRQGKAFIVTLLDISLGDEEAQTCLLPEAFDAQLRTETENCFLLICDYDFSSSIMRLSRKSQIIQSGANRWQS
jgi:hypothetical protein